MSLFSPTTWTRLPSHERPDLSPYHAHSQIQCNRGPTRGSVHLRHTGGFNAFFSDGHARFMRETQHSNWLKNPDAPSGDKADLPQYR